MTKIFRQLWLFSIVLLIASCSKFEKLRKSGTDDEKYKAASEYYRLKEYGKASLLFEEIIPLLKGSTELEMASFYQAYCDYHTGSYQTASFHFKQFADTWARSDYAEEARYRSAEALYLDAPEFYLDQSSTSTASEALQSFVNNYPESKFAAEASKILKELRIKLETKAFEKAKLYYKTSPSNIANYRAAVIAINNFQRDYPDSDYMEEMLFVRVLSQYNYALNSFENKKKERYTETEKFYLEMIDKYPNSKYLKQLEKNYEVAQTEITRLKKEEKEKEKEKAEQANKTGKVAGATN
jgi:outer membrane protein assembly factor BamD